jgi:hypothetical protein
MSVHDVADLLFAARGRIDSYWSLYVVVVVAVMGWLMSRKRVLPVSMKALVSVVFLVAASSSLAGLHSSYTIAEALRTDLLRVAGDTPLVETRALLERHSYLRQRRNAAWIHAGIAAAVLAAVWLSRPLEPDAGGGA